MPDGLDGLVAPPGQKANGGDDPVIFRITIEYHKSGAVMTATTDPHARMLIYGLLEMARDAALKAHLELMAQAAPPAGKIAVVPDGVLPKFPRG